jgi:hypothetical protein
MVGVVPRGTRRILMGSMTRGWYSFQNQSIMTGGTVLVTNNNDQLRPVQLPTLMKTTAATAIQMAMRYQRDWGELIIRIKLSMDHCGLPVDPRLSQSA